MTQKKEEFNPPAPIKVFQDPELQELYDERAAIIEFDGGYSRQYAQMKAGDEIKEFKKNREKK